MSQAQYGDMEPDVTYLIENLIQKDIGKQAEAKEIVGFFKAHDDFKEE